MPREALSNQHFSDLNPVILGQEHCAPNHLFGPAVRKYVLIHFVVSGKGIFCRDGIEYPVSAGEAFIIFPNEITTYFADKKDPWFYQWIGFDGALSDRFLELPPVFEYKTNWAGEMLKINEEDTLREHLIASKLFLMYADLLSERKPTNRYVENAKDYINALYMQRISIEQLAESLNLDRRYLSRIFKQQTGKTLQEYLIWVRMEEAKKLLARGSSVADAAQLCGYDDVCNFSKMFKRLYGISPSRWS